MIHIFRIFNHPRTDYLEFIDRADLITHYNRQKDMKRHHWQVVYIKHALQEENRWSQRQSLEALHKLGEKRVIKVVANGQLHWYSPSNSHGIPSEYQIALQHFTDDCKFYKVTTRHHEIFKVIRDPRFQNIHHEIIDNILSRVRASRCPTRLDRYLDLNLNKLHQYGVELDRLHGTYSDIRETIRRNSLNCPLFSDFILRLMDICIEKERELLGTEKVYLKQLKTG